MRFACDNAICTVPAKSIVDPPSSSLKVGQECKVEWREKDVTVLSAMVLAMGKCLACSVVHGR